MYVNIIIYSNKLLLFVRSTLNKEKKKKTTCELSRITRVFLYVIPVRIRVPC